MNPQRLSAEHRAGALVKNLREAAGLTQRELAVHMVDRGFTTWSQTAVFKTETGKRPLRLDEFVALCEIFDQPAGLTLTILQGPEIKREARLAELRARVIAAQREAREARDLAEVRTTELHELAQQLERLEAEGCEVDGVDVVLLDDEREEQRA